MFQLPSSTLVNRKIPKNKFYEKLKANHHLRELFTDQVESIIWKHKLSKDTIRLEPKENVEEIQVFEVYLKKKSYSFDLLRSIDKAIPYPILYVLMYGDQVKLAIAYKERNQIDGNRSVVRSYHETDWQPVESIELDILQGMDLKAVYENIIRQLLPIKMKPEMELSAVLERQSQIDKLMRECERLESKLRAEKQFNRKVELNMELQRKKKELNQLLN
ncbi:MAG: Methyl-accepting chemotaxis protein [Candidatus Carbobacillus altaicus]|uniref:Methyl-accepting chemotaxis protein n=1 Tax=Candidatus Carbonibacillus altaicus TaxID=2163959 RepID=A0A2R6XZJ0_9BACL|nr:MAG: Methyl-accepting chemotaxis protein [Candidatus Carbobacillus altaicus]